LNRPRALAFDSQGNLWVADTGNNRVLRFNGAILDGLNPEADVVVGQHDFTTNTANHGATLIGPNGLDTPAGLAFDPQGNLYVSDFNNARVLRFPSPVGADANANAVFGQASFTTRAVPAQASASTMAGPAGLSVDSSGNLYVAVPADNRILMFATSGVSGTPARDHRPRRRRSADFE
jgi:sugar lactone lactonase YvrE